MLDHRRFAAAERQSSAAGAAPRAFMSRGTRIAAAVCCSTWYGLALLGQLLGTGWPDVGQHTLLARPEPQVVGPRLAQAEGSVGASAALVDIAVVLAIVLPEADLADLERGPLTERLAPATRAAEWQIARSGVKPGG